MNRFTATCELRQRLRDGGRTIGSWMQLGDASVAEIMGQAGYDWVAVDLEHGSIGVQQLPNLFRALELGGTLPLARLAQGHPKDCKQALDAGAAGVIVPMVETAQQLTTIRKACCWPPVGRRGVGFSRANLFGKHFDAYAEEAQTPLLVAMIEHEQALQNLEQIVAVEGLDALLIGPYDLSASMGLTGQFQAPEFGRALAQIQSVAQRANMPCGVHVVTPAPGALEERIAQGFRFIAYGIDAVFLIHACRRDG